MIKGNLKIIQTYNIMKPSDFHLQPQVHLPMVTLQQLTNYPQLQKRINSKQFEISGIHNLITEMKKHTIDHLKQEFIANNNEVNLTKFIWLMCKTLSVEHLLEQVNREFYYYELAYQLVKVFEQIDIDNSNSISWEELIEYMTCSSLTNVRTDAEEEEGMAKKVGEVVFSHWEKAVFRKNTVREILELERHGLLGIVENKSDRLKFIDINGSASREFQLYNVDCNKVLSIDYSQNDRMFGILMNTHLVVFVEDGEMQKNHGQMRFSRDEIQIKYLPLHESWLLLSFNNNIQIFTPPKGRGHAEEQPKVLKFRSHSSNVVSIKELKNPLSLCTASFDGQIKIWSVLTNTLLVILRPNMEEDFRNCKSIKGIDTFNNSITTYIICWMFSGDISVWLPSTSLSKPYIGALKGHSSIVESAKFLTNFPIVLSIDKKYCVRASSVEKMECLQTWRISESSCPKIFVFKSIPYVAFYNKLLQYYKIQREEDLSYFNAKKNQLQSLQSKKKIQSTSNSVVLAVDYCNYYDCLLVLLEDTLKVIAINTGKIYNEINSPDNTHFLSMCLKEQRRVFVSNTNFQIFFYRIDDGSLVLKLTPFETLPRNIKNKKEEEYHDDQNSYEIFGIEFNPIIQAFIVIAECQRHSKLFVYDSSVGYEPLKIKDIVFNQKSLCSFTSAPQTNYLYISSNKPSIITIWSYDSFTILRVFEFPSPLMHLSAEFLKYNLLIVTENYGIRIMQIPVLDPRKNYRKTEESFIKKQIFVRTKERLHNCEIIHRKPPQNMEKSKVKRKVTFFDENSSKTYQEQVNISTPSEHLLSVLTVSSSVFILNTAFLFDKLTAFDVCNYRNQKNYLTREERKIELQPEKYTCENRMLVQCDDVIVEVNNTLKSEVKLFGKIKDMFFVSTNDGILNFFQADALLCGKILFPNSELLHWDICYPLVEKIITRLKNVQKLSEDLKLYKRTSQTPSSYFQLSFILNKYFTEQDLPKIKQYFNGLIRKPKGSMRGRRSTNLAVSDDMFKALEEETKEKVPTNVFEEIKQNNVFQKIYNLKMGIKNASYQKKIKEIEQKYSRAFKFIKQRRQQDAIPNKNHIKESKNESQEKTKLSVPKLKFKPSKSRKQKDEKMKNIKFGHELKMLKIEVNRKYRSKSKPVLAKSSKYEF